MMLATAIDGSQSLLAQLVNPAARAILLACGAGVGLAAFRVRAASLRLFTWTAVLYAALAMPLLGWLLPPLSIPAPAFFPQATEPVATEITGLPSSLIRVRSVAEPSLAGSEPAKKTPSPDAVKQISPPSSSLSQQARLHSTSPLAATTSSWFLGSSHLSSLRWSAVAAGIYLAVALLLLIRLVVGLIFARRLIQASQPIREPRVTQKLACSANPSGLSFVPQVAESEFISVPVTMGALRPTILLPAGWREWNHTKLDAVVAHELSHVARRDALTQRLSLLHRAIFWFSPLAWWLDRHLADMAEQASDEAALSSGTDRNDYARTLLGFFEALQAAPGRVWWQGVSMAKAGQAERRVERILAWKGAVTVSLKKSIAVVIIALAVPVVYLAAAARPAQSSQPAVRTQAQAPPAAQNATPAAPATPPAEDAVPSTAADAPLDGPDAPALAPATPPPPGDVAGGVSTGVPAPVRPTTPMAPIVPVRPVAPPAAWVDQAATSSSTHRHRYSYSYGYDEQRFVIVTGNTDSLTMSGSSEDAEHAEKLRKQIPGDFIWFERDERSYIIRDQATIDRARKLWAPQEELGKKQEALGKQQEALGKQQQALGERMRQIQVKVPDMTAELDKLRGELKQLSSGATVEQVGRIQSEIGELQSRIGQVQSHAGEEQSKLGEEMGALGEKQGKLGAQQGELGRQQGELAEEASRQMKQLLDEAIKKGTAQPEPQTGGTASL